ncbi:thioredoxin family protein [Mariniblastus sp.]|nr:thioredoxin family protein [Mariniblastus sp.]
MAQYQVGDRYASFGQTDGQSQPRPRIRNQAEELGNVAWGRDLNAAKAKSAETGKPILLLFQEVPG